MTISPLTWTLELTRPGMLLLACSLVPVVWYARRSLVDFPAWQRHLSLVVRGLLLVLLVLAAAGVNVIRRDHRQFVVFLVDRSDSIDETAAEQADRFVADAARHCGQRDADCVIDFAGNVLPPRRVGEQAGSRAALDGGHTDLAAALAAAWASIPAFYAKTLVVLSDGRATRGDALQIAHTAHLAGVRICTVPLTSGGRDEVQLTAVRGPAQVRTGAPLELVVEVTSNHQESAELQVFRNEILVGTKSVKLTSGANRFVFRQTASSDRFQTYQVRVRASRDHFVDNNTAAVLIACEGKPRVLLVETTPRDARYLAWALEKEDIIVDVRGPRGVPRTLADLQNFELLVLSNVAATELTKRQMQLIRSYVQDLGGGLIMIGGDKSFGLGGYYKTVLEEILPVRSDFEKEKEKPSLAMVLVIDKSGSMGGEKIELAKEAAKSAAELLGPRDQVGVIAFDGSAKWISEIHSASDRDYVIERISSLTAGGGTNLAPALSDAYRGLEGVTAKLKHVIAMTDGHSQPGNFFEIVSAMRDSKITVSTVAVGTGADQELLERIANWGDGRSYFTDDPGHIPQIFARETMEASQSAINERPFLPVQVQAHQLVRGIDFDAAPFLLGYVITRAKPTAQLVLATEAGHPLLATWRYGLGKSLAFTSDAKNRWAAEWLQWPGFGKFWSQTVRDTMRTTTHAAMEVQLVREDGRMRATVDAMHRSPQRAGEYLDDVTTRLDLIRPGASAQQVVLRQIAPGRYTGSFPVEDSSMHYVRIVQEQKGVELQAVSRGVAVGYSAEYRVGPANESMLRQLAEVGGGTYQVTPGDVFQKNASSIRVQPLWPVLIALVLGLLVVDIALRRIDFTVLLGRAKPWAQQARRQGEREEKAVAAEELPTETEDKRQPHEVPS